MSINNQDFDNWNIVKKRTNKINMRVTIKPRDIFWAKIGKNIGTEEFGKGKEFTRPILVINRLTFDLFLGIPLTTTIKDSDKYFHTIKYQNYKKQNLTNTAMILQLKSFSTKRVLNKIGV